MPKRDHDAVKIEGALGKYSLPTRLFYKFAPAISKWIIPGIGVSIGIYFACEGIAKIVTAFMGTGK